MARPTRHDADYFPFYCKNGATFTILRQKYSGPLGIGIFTELWIILTTTPYHHLLAEAGSGLTVLAARLGISEDALVQFLDHLTLTGKIDKELWDTASVIVSEDHLGSIKDAYAKRTDPIISIDEIREKYLGIIAPFKPPKSRKPKSKTDDDILKDFERPPGSTIDALMKHWNTHKELPKARGSSVNISAPKLSEMIQKVALFSAAEIEKAIDNLAKYWEKIEARFRPGSFDRFVTQSIELWVDDAKPWEKFKDEKKAKKFNPIEPRWCPKCRRRLEDDETAENCPVCKERADPNWTPPKLETSRTAVGGR